MYKLWFWIFYVYALLHQDYASSIFKHSEYDTNYKDNDIPTGEDEESMEFEAEDTAKEQLLSNKGYDWKSLEMASSSNPPYHIDRKWDDWWKDWLSKNREDPTGRIPLCTDKVNRLAECRRELDNWPVCVGERSGELKACSNFGQEDVAVPACTEIETKEITTCGTFSKVNLCLYDSSGKSYAACKPGSNNVTCFDGAKIEQCSSQMSASGKQVPVIQALATSETDKDQSILSNYQNSKKVYEAEKNSIAKILKDNERICQDELGNKTTNCNVEWEVDFLCLAAISGKVNSCEKFNMTNEFVIPLCMQTKTWKVITCGKFSTGQLCAVNDTTLEICKSSSNRELCLKTSGELEKCSHHEPKDNKDYDYMDYYPENTTFPGDYYGALWLLSPEDNETLSEESTSGKEEINSEDYGSSSPDEYDVHDLASRQNYDEYSYEPTSEEYSKEEMYLNEYDYSSPDAAEEEISNENDDGYSYPEDKEPISANEETYSGSYAGEYEDEGQATMQNDDEYSYEPTSEEYSKEEIYPDEYGDSSPVENDDEEQTYKQNDDVDESYLVYDDDGSSVSGESEVEEYVKYEIKDYIAVDDEETTSKESDDRSFSSQSEEMGQMKRRHIRENPHNGTEYSKGDISNEIETTDDSGTLIDKDEFPKNASYNLGNENITFNVPADMQLQEDWMISEFHTINTHLCKGKHSKNEELINCDKTNETLTGKIMLFACIGARSRQIKPCHTFLGTEVALPVCSQNKTKFLVTCDIFSNVNLCLKGKKPMFPCRNEEDYVCLGEDGRPSRCQKEVQEDVTLTPDMAAHPENERFFHLDCTNCTFENKMVVVGTPDDVLSETEFFTFPSA